MAFRLALSGLNAASADLAVTANNIANTGTTGFKSSRAEFAELFSVSATGVSNITIGNGVRVANVAQQFTQGNIDFTDNSLDLAISGQGFFILSDGGALAYTRAGAFKVDREGYVVNSSNQRLQVFPPTPAGGFNTGSLSDLRLVTSESAPAATTTVEMVLNLPANSSPPPIGTFNAADPDSYNQASSMTIYDSLGAAHTASVYFVKTAAPNTWQQYLYIDGNPVGTAQTLVFSNTGSLITPASGRLTFPAYTPTTGAAPLTLTYDFGQATQYGGPFTVNAITQDGYTTGRLIGIDTDSTGIVQARFTNGRSQPLGQIALAQFSNPNGLQQLGDTNWAETFTSGQALKGQAGNAGLGLIQSGALEASNVDITEQLVNMITAQRNFQANAQMISTADTITQTIINIR
ncbi:MAG: flagellar hook protein FlgE [Steroidobacteraceae bacterium]|nr:flagellar hook protein FlgE [Steroidobacteraceae bacterium]MDW8258550.1 flagellar hook protein FlgE [Gammaproteobacteria bacterium]